MNMYLALDQGSHASRAALFDENGRQLAQASIPLVIECSRPGRAEYTAARVIASVGSALQQVIGAVSRDSSGRVLACGIAVQRSTVLAWRSDGTPLGPVLSWQDVRAAPQVAALAGRRKRIREISDLPLSAYYGASKMAWLLDNAPAVRTCPRSSLRLSPLASYLAFKLLDNHPYVVDHSIAQRTQLMDTSTLDWSGELAGLFGVPLEALPRCVPMVDTHGSLAGTTIPVTTMCGDQNAAFFGMGKCGVDAVAINVGSGAFILHEPLRKPGSDSPLLCGVARTDSHGASYLQEATVNGAGNALQWLQQRYAFERLHEQLPIWLKYIVQPPVFINTVGGLGTPWMRDDIEPFFVDDASREPAERAVAVIESIVFLLARNIALIDAPLARIRIGGGLSSLDGLCQKLCNLAGMQVERCEYTETTARGAAWLAAGSPSGWFERDACAIFVPEPDPGLQSRYRRFLDTLQLALEKGR